MKRRLVAELRGAGDGAGGWQVTVGDAPVRTLAADVTARRRLPVPPDGAGMDAGDLAAVVDRLERNDPLAGDAVAVGRHLLACLFSDAAWAEARDSAEHLDLVVATDDDARELDGLPWELLHDGERFLAARTQPTVTISRAVGAPATATQSVQIRPTILVVVGGSLDEPELQPAAEYVALFDTLRRGKLAIDAHLVVRARPADVQDACRDLRPDVVHVIAHGDRGTIQLAPPKPGDKPARLDADQLVSLVEAGGAPPRVLVLTACRTAASAGGPAATSAAAGPDSAATSGSGAFVWHPSLAAACVQRGVPIVAAMTGAIASRACREFTFGFYSTLLSGGDAVAAAAAGRRAAFVEGDPPATAVDWAYPAIFCGPGVDGRVTVTGADVLAARATRARELLTNFRSPPTFCGRHEITDAFRRLLAPAVASPPSALALCVPQDVAVDLHVGASRALATLGATAALAGHAVAYLNRPAGDDHAASFRTLAGQLVYQAQLGAKAAGASPPDHTQLQLLATPQDERLAPDLRGLLDLAGVAPGADQTVGLALRLDLAAIGRAVVQLTSGLLVVLVDDLHRYGPAVKPLLDEAVTIHGLGTNETRVPFVFTYGEVPDTSGTGAVQAVRDFVQTGSVVRVEVRLFSPPAAWLAYQQLLLGGDEPLVPVPERRDKVLARIHEESRGTPYLFDKGEVRSAIRAFRDVDALVPATDAERLAQLTGQPDVAHDMPPGGTP